jgi:hypothetical protein
MPEDLTLDAALKLLRCSAIEEDFFSKEYYVKRQEVMNRLNEIKEYILHAEQVGTKILFWSHMGAGKSTELRRLNEELKQEGFHVISVSSQEEIPSDLDYADILLSLMKKTLELIKGKAIKLENKTIQNVLKLLKQLTGQDIEIDEENGLDSQIVTVMYSLLHDQFGLPLPPSTRTKAHELGEKMIIPIFNEILSVVANRVVFIIEHIEKQRNLENLEKCLIDFSRTIQRLNCCVVVAVLHSIKYDSDFMNSVGEIYPISGQHFLPIFQVRNSDGSENKEEIKLMKDIVRRRGIPESLIPDNVIERSAKLSGGIVSEFIDNLRVCCIKAIAAKRPNVDINMLNEHIRKKIDNAYDKGAQKYTRKLNELYDGENLRIKWNVTNDADLKNMLLEQSILEYRDKDDKPYYGIHPLLLEEKTWWAKSKIEGE